MKNELKQTFSHELVNEIRNIINNAQNQAIRAVDTQRVLMYWSIGERIFVEEQGKNKRADYGSFLIKNLAKELTKEFGSGFSIRQLELCRQFYLTFPIANALRSQLNWTQYKLITRIKDKDKQTYYIEESCKNSWSARELERQINSGLYERLLLSSNKEKVLAVAKGEEVVQNPTIGILLCADKNDKMVKMVLPKDNSTILTSKYQLYLPSKEQILELMDVGD